MFQKLCHTMLLFVLGEFILNTWAGWWFKNQEYDPDAYEVLLF